MSTQTARPLIQAAEVAGRSVRRDLLHRGDTLLQVVTGRAPVRRPEVRWRVVDVDLGERNFRFRYTEPVAGSEHADQPWAINIHGYFAGGSMYARESEILAERMGWRLVNPSLPGFGGSDPLAHPDVTISDLSQHLDIVREKLGIERFIALGHSMGGAVAIDYADTHPAAVLGIVYRDGVATPDWQDRSGWPARLFQPVLPEFAAIADLVSAVTLDASDLLVGHLFRTLADLWPDLHSNVRAVAGTAPIARLLMGLDLTDTVRRVAARGTPIYTVWGCFDRVVTSPAAASFARASGGEIQWVPGGHLWMLARPSGQSDLLTVNPSGVRFMRRVRELAG